MINGRDFVTPDDIKSLAVPTLSHRVLMASGGSAGNNRKLGEEILAGIVDEVPIP